MWNGNDNARTTTKKSKKGFGGIKVKWHLPLFSSASKRNTNGSHTPPCAVAWWYLLVVFSYIFSHWVIQNYNMHAALVLQIPEGIISPLCSRATPKVSYFVQNKCPWYGRGIFYLIQCFHSFIILYWIYWWSNFGWKRRPTYLSKVYEIEFWEGLFKKLVSTTCFKLFVSGIILLFKQGGITHNYHELLSIIVLIIKNQSQALNPTNKLLQNK